jgi:hypothetical protein
MDIGKPGTRQEREELTANQGIPAAPTLEFHEAVNCPAGVSILGMEVRGAVIAFNNGHRAAFFQERTELSERPHGICKMLQYEADKDMIETLRFEREAEDIPLTEGHVGNARLQDPFLRPVRGIIRNIDGGDQGTGAVPCKDHGLGTDTAAGFEHPGTRGEVRVIVKEFRQRLGLGGKTRRFAG